MKFCNLSVDGESHLAVLTEDGYLDLSSEATMEELIAGKLIPAGPYPVVENPVYANILNHPGKLICVGLNYKAHADNVNMGTAECPILFSKFADSLVPSGAEVELPPWEDSYDYEAELVIVMGKTAWNVSVDEALDYVFGYTCGNDFSCRVPQKRTSQWLIGKAMPGFGPCGPVITVAEAFHVEEGKSVRSYVNGELRQDGNTADMIHSCAEIISYASKYFRLEPGDLIFTGTPSGVQLEKADANWLKPGDLVEVEIEGIGKLVNKMK